MATWRLWEDLKLAIGRHLEHRYGPLEGPRAEAERRRWPTTRNPNQIELTETFRQITYRRLSRNDVHPWQFWRTVSDTGYQRHRLPILVPRYAVRPTEHHAFWISIWEGLGDFASDRGYSWHDRDAKEFMERHGLEPFVHPNEVTREQEEFFRDVFLTDVREDPAWYAGVLARRTWSTLTLARLRPSRAVDGRSLDPEVRRRGVSWRARRRSPASWPPPCPSPS